MNKILNKIRFALLIIVFIVSTPFLNAGRGGGAAFGGALAGSMIGSVVSSAATRDSGKASRAEAEAVRAQDQTAALRHEQQLRRELELARKSETNQIIMMFAFVILFLIIGALIVLLIRKKR